MRILIIGGTRFIGPHVVRDLLERGHDVTLFNTGKTGGEVPTSVRHIQGDRKELRSFSKEFQRINPEVVIDMIAYTESDALDAAETFKNIARRAVVLSSMDVYLGYDKLRGIQAPPLCEIPFTEQSELRTNLYPYRAQAENESDLLYNYEKVLVERIYSCIPGLAVTLLRLPAVYGPGDYQHRFFEFLKRMDDNRPYILLDEARAGWRWTRGYVQNVAAAIALMATDERAAGRVYNIGEYDTLTEKEWIRSIAQAAKWNGEIITLPKGKLPETISPRLNWEQAFFADTSRIRKEFTFVDPLPRTEALKRTVDWERSNPPEKVDLNQFDYALEDTIRTQNEENSKDHIIA